MIALIKKIFNIPYVKFLFVAGINTSFGFLIYSLTVFSLKNVDLSINVFQHSITLMKANSLLNTDISVVVSTIIAVLFNFKTYGALVFKTKDNSKLLKFIGVYLVSMSLQMLFLKLLSQVGISNPYIAGGILLLPMSLLSFILMRTFVFKKGINED